MILIIVMLRRIRRPDHEMYHYLQTLTSIIMLSCVEVSHLRRIINVNAEPLNSHVRDRQEQVPSLRTDHKGIVSSYGLCANDAFACTSKCAAIYDKEDHASCFAMVARRPSHNESIDALIVAAKPLVRQLEEVRSAEAHGEHDHGRPRLRSTSSKRSISKSDLAVTFKEIVKEAQSQMAKLGELIRDARTRKTRTGDTRAADTRAANKTAGSLGAI
jgi:hypothetical protein